jgi:hypothetical protein
LFEKGEQFRVDLILGVLAEAILGGSAVQLRVALPTRRTLFQAWAVVRYQLDLHHGFEFVSLTEEERLSVRQFCNQLAGEQAARSAEV